MVRRDREVLSSRSHRRSEGQYQAECSLHEEDKDETLQPYIGYVRECPMWRLVVVYFERYMERSSGLVGIHAQNVTYGGGVREDAL